jgi:hypothetical protein
MACISGTLGAWLFTYLFVTNPVFAEKPAGSAKALSAENFFIVDEQGKVRAALSLSPDNGQPALVLLDKQGKVRLRAGLMNDGHPAVYVDGKDGVPFWYEP